MKTKLLLILASIFLIASCSKKDIPEPIQNNTDITTTAPNPDEDTTDSDTDTTQNIPIAENETHYITLTTSKKVGEEISLWFEATEVDQAGVWIDLNGNGKRDEKEGVTNFGRWGKIYTLETQNIVVYGKFYSFDCFNNQVTKLDISKNTNLKRLCALYNQLSALDVSKNTNLTHLDIHMSQLSTLDVSENTALEYLNCYGNKLSTLDVSNNTSLTHLDASFNQLSTLDISKITALTILKASGNKLTTLDVSKNTALTKLKAYNNKLSGLDISKNQKLNKLSLSGNKIKDSNEMQAIVDALPKSGGKFYVIDNQTSKENYISKKQVKIAKEKGWEVKDIFNEYYDGE